MPNKQTKAKLACIDCHFLVIEKLKADYGFNPPRLCSTNDHFETSPTEREQIKRKEAIAPDCPDEIEMHIDGFDFETCCHKDCWHGLYLRDHEDRYTTVVKTDRSDCFLFYQYRPTMDFEVADQFRIKGELSQSIQNKSKTVAAPVAENVKPSEKQESENGRVITIDRDRKLLKYNGTVEKLEPKQLQLFELLWEKKDEVVQRSVIDKVLWPGTYDIEPVSPIQIEQQINKLKDGLEKLGFKRDVIATHRKTHLCEGGYELHGNITSYLKES